MNLFSQHKIKPMFTFQMSPLFEGDDWIFELNLSGIRCIAYLDENSTDLRDCNNLPLLPIFPELKNLHLQCKRPCILDGELILLNNGQMDSTSMSNRLSNPNASTKTPVSYVAYDLLFQDDTNTMNLPLLTRKQLLEDCLMENIDLTISRYADSHSFDLYQTSKLEQLKGIIAKRKSSIYLPDQHTKDWIQIFSTPLVHSILCGYRLDASGNKFYLFGKIKSNLLVYLGQVDSSKCPLDILMKQRYEELLKKKRTTCPLVIAPVFPHDHVIWLEPELVFQFEPGPNRKHPLSNAKFLGIHDGSLRLEPANE